MPSYLFDTSYIISLLNIADSNYHAATRDISDLSGDFFINPTILAESYTVINYKMGFPAIAILEKFIEEMDIKIVWSNDTDHISFFKHLQWRISVADASVLYDSLKYGFQVLTFDQEMIQVQKSLI